MMSPPAITPDSYAFTIPGKPRGKGRPRFGKGRTYTDAKTLAYERMVKTSAATAIGSLGPFSGPVAAFLTFRLCPPVSASKGRRARLLAGHEPIKATFDLDNLIKAVLDGLNGVAFVDDRQVVSLAAHLVAAEVDGVDVIITPFRAS